MLNRESKIPNRLLAGEAFKEIPFRNKFLRILNWQVDEALRDERNHDPYGRPNIVNTSVVIPTHNNQITLPVLFDSINLQSTTGQTEVLVVDNHSTDNTAKTAKKWGAEVVKSSGYRFTQAEAINEGVEKASHDLIFVCEPTSVLSNREQLFLPARHFQNPNVSGVFSRPLPYVTSSFFEAWRAAWDLQFFNEDVRITTHAGAAVKRAGGFMVRKTAFEDAGGLDPGLPMKPAKVNLVKNMTENGGVIAVDPTIALHRIKLD